MPSSRRPSVFAPLPVANRNTPQPPQGGHRGRDQKTGTPTLRLHHQARAERPERRTEPGQPEKESDDSRLFSLAERACD